MLATSVETQGVDLRTTTNQLWVKEKTGRKKCDVRFSLIRKSRVSQNNSVSLSLFMEVNNLEVEEELSTKATLILAEGVWRNRWRKELKA